MYELSQLHLYHIPTKKITNVSAALDRSVQSAVWSSDGKFIYALIEDDRKQNISEFDIAKHQSRPPMRLVYAVDGYQTGKWSVLFGTGHPMKSISEREMGSTGTNISAEFLALVSPIWKD
jgi:hypothetical protein